MWNGLKLHWPQTLTKQAIVNGSTTLYNSSTDDTLGLSIKDVNHLTTQHTAIYILLLV